MLMNVLITPDIYDFFFSCIRISALYTKYLLMKCWVLDSLVLYMEVNYIRFHYAFIKVECLST